MDVQEWHEAVMAAHRSYVGRYVGLLRGWPVPLRWELLPEPACDEFGQAVFGRWGGWLLGINAMIFNERLVLWREAAGGPANSLENYRHGWCYDKGGPALLALAGFDPAVMGEPEGFRKRATSGVRAAGEVAPGWSG